MVGSSIRIISSTDAIAVRAFPQWRVSFVDAMGAPDTADGLDVPTLVPSLWDIVLRIIQARKCWLLLLPPLVPRYTERGSEAAPPCCPLQLGTQLSNIHGEEKIDTALKSLHTFAADIPRPEVVMSATVSSSRQTRGPGH